MLHWALMALWLCGTIESYHWRNIHDQPSKWQIVGIHHYFNQSEFIVHDGEYRFLKFARNDLLSTVTVLANHSSSKATLDTRFPSLNANILTTATIADHEIAFVHPENRSTLYNTKSGTITSYSSALAVCSKAGFINSYSQPEGYIFCLNQSLWYLQKAWLTEHLWFDAPPLIIMEGRSEKFPTSSLERTWMLIYDPIGRHNRSELDSVSDIFHPVKWRWAQGMVAHGLYMHVFTDTNVYLMEVPHFQVPYLNRMSQSKQALMIELKVLQVSYAEYFVCANNYTAEQLDQLFRVLIQMKPMAQKNLIGGKLATIYTLFALHFVVALTMMIFVIVMALKSNSSDYRSLFDESKINYKV